MWTREAEYSFVFEDIKGWWANISGKLLGPYKTRADALAGKMAYL